MFVQTYVHPNNKNGILMGSETKIDPALLFFG